MTDNVAIWKTLQKHLPKRRWIPLSEILATVRFQIRLDDEDLVHADSGTGTPRWESNVYRLLRTKTQGGGVRARKSRRRR
jgi:hypothetical protein